MEEINIDNFLDEIKHLAQQNRFLLQRSRQAAPHPCSLFGFAYTTQFISKLTNNIHLLQQLAAWLTRAKDVLLSLQKSFIDWASNEIQAYQASLDQTNPALKVTQLDLAQYELLANCRRYIHMAKQRFTTHFSGLEKRYLAVLVELSADLRQALQYYSGSNWQLICQTACNELEQSYDQMAGRVHQVFEQLFAKNQQAITEKFHAVLHKWQLNIECQLDHISLTYSIKQRYKKLARTLHPDLHPELGTEGIQALNQDYEFLLATLEHAVIDFSAHEESTDVYPRPSQM